MRGKLPVHGPPLCRESNCRLSFLIAQIYKTERRNARNYKKLTNLELLREALLERRDTAVAETLLNEYGSLLEAILIYSDSELPNGLEKRKQAQIMALHELVRRLMTVDYGRGDYKIKSLFDVADLVMNKLKFKKHEEAWIFCVNQSHIVMDRFQLAVGGVASVLLIPVVSMRNHLKWDLVAVYF